MLKKKVAVCISGAVRGNLKELELVKKNIVDPLDADVFFTTWDSYYKWPGVCGGQNVYVDRNFGSKASRLIPNEFISLSNFNKIFPKTVEMSKVPIIEEVPVDKIKKILNPIRLNICKQELFDNYIEDFHLGYDPKLWKNQLKMYYLMYVCNKNLIDIGNELNIKYDYTIRMRPDLYIGNKMEIDTLLSLKENSISVDMGAYGVQDQCFAGSSDVMNRICSFWIEMNKSKRLSIFSDYPEAEGHWLIALWCMKNKISCDTSHGWGRQYNHCSFETMPDFREKLEQDYDNIVDLSVKQAVTPFYDYMMSILNQRSL